MGKKNKKALLIGLSLLYLSILLICLTACTKYISQKILTSNENIALDIATLVSNNFEITDQEVTYMKSLTFNEMEVDPINLRLMNIGQGAVLQAKIINIYLIAPLQDQEVKYITDEENAETFECAPGTRLNAIWLLNGIFDEKGQFVAKQREDIYRYTDTTEEYQRAFTERKSFGTYSSDEWGNFITGYVPIYTVEGNYVGMLGIDMDPDQYQKDIMKMVLFVIFSFAISTISLIILFVYLYFKYAKAKENKIYSDFYSKMSHDMRTPMNGIMGMASLAEQEYSVNTLHEYFRKVGESGEYLLQLINDTLDVSKINSGKLTLHENDAKCMQIIENVVDMIQMTAHNKDIDFSANLKQMDVNCFIHVDDVRLKQIFVNLLTNALKYTKPGGKVYFGAQSEQRGNLLHCQFIVQDNGVGMSEDYVKNMLFHPFAQENNVMSDYYTGSGLGLAITKSLIDLMKGSIQVQSKIGEGTIFRVVLDFPIAVEESNAQQEAGEGTQQNIEVIQEILQGKRILLCEDHPLNVEIAAKLLQKKGCLVDVAENGQVGVDKFKASSETYYDVILMDIRMPVMDGLEATRQIRNLDRSDAKSIPIIAMTANAYAEDIQNTQNAGMNAHLSKPIKPDQMYQTIAEILQKALEK